MMIRIAGIMALLALCALPCTAFTAEGGGVAQQPGTAAAPETAKSPAAAAGVKRPRIGYADMMKLAEQSDAGKVARTHFDAKADRHKAQIETKQKLLEKEKATLEAKLATYTPEQRTARIKAYEKKVDDLKKLLQAADKEMRPMQEELFRELYGKIEKAAKEYGDANGFAAIVEKKELLYLSSGVDAEDVTAPLLELLNRK